MNRVLNYQSNRIKDILTMYAALTGLLLATAGMGNIIAMYALYISIKVPYDFFYKDFKVSILSGNTRESFLEYLTAKILVLSAGFTVIVGIYYGLIKYIPILNKWMGAYSELYISDLESGMLSTTLMQFIAQVRTFLFYSIISILSLKHGKKIFTGFVAIYIIFGIVYSLEVQFALNIGNAINNILYSKSFLTGLLLNMVYVGGLFLIIRKLILELDIN